MSYKPATQRRLNQPTNGSDVVVGVLVQIARKYLFIRPVTKVLFYLGLVSVLSVVSSYLEPSEHYLVQKHNILNAYGTKLGWFWTLLVLTPFVALTSFLHHKSVQLTARHLLRLAIATLFWYMCTTTFIAFEKMTGKCLGVKGIYQRRECFDNGGKWVPGFDISGHAFILIYSMLVMDEEVSSFRNWPSSPKTAASPKKGTTTQKGTTTSKSEFDEHQRNTRTIQWLFLVVLAVHLVWDLQLVITCLYYHTISHKVIGALFAVLSWFVTYKCWYPRYFPRLPIRRQDKAF